METNRDNTGDKAQAGQDQRTQQEQAPINPFRDAAGKRSEPTVEEETALEQQRKDAVTERD